MLSGLKGLVGLQTGLLLCRLEKQNTGIKGQKGKRLKARADTKLNNVDVSVNFLPLARSFTSFAVSSSQHLQPGNTKKEKKVQGKFPPKGVPVRYNINL